MRTAASGNLDDVESNDVVTVQGRIENIGEIKPRRNLTLLRSQCAVILKPALWFNQPFGKGLTRELPITVTGKVERNLYGYEVSVIDYAVGNFKNRFM